MGQNTNNAFIATIVATDDTTGNVPINFGTGNPAFDSAIAKLERYHNLSAGANVIAISTPSGIAAEVYIKNVDPNNKTVTVTWTPNGGASATVIVLNSGDQIIFWTNPSGNTPGISALTLTPSAANALVEFFIGGI